MAGIVTIDRDFKYGWLSGALAAMLSSLTHAAPATTQSSLEIPDTVSSAIHRLQQSFEGVKDVAFEFEQTVRVESERVVSFRKGTAKLRTELGFELAKSKTTSTRDDRAMEFESIAFVGPTSTGDWASGGTVAEEYQYLNIASMSDAARARAVMHGAPHVEHYAFGHGGKFLWQVLDDSKKRPESYSWQADAQPDARGLLKVVLSVKQQEREHASQIYLLDTTKGFIVSHFELRNRSGAVIREFDIHISETVRPGVWFPDTLVHKTYSNQKLVDTASILVKNLIVNPGFSDDDFTVDSLNLDVGASLVRTSADGKEVVLHRTVDGFSLALESESLEVAGITLPDQQRRSNLLLAFLLLFGALVFFLMAARRSRKVSA